MALTKVQTEMAGTGAVLQVVAGTLGSQVSTTSSSFVDTGLSATITPKSATSKILVMVHHAGNYRPSGTNYTQFRLLRNSTTLIGMESVAVYTNNTSPIGGETISTAYLDSPATTSSTTYKTQFCSGDGTNTIQIQVTNGVQPTSTITLMEIAG